MPRGRACHLLPSVFPCIKSCSETGPGVCSNGLARGVGSGARLSSGVGSSAFLYGGGGSGCFWYGGGCAGGFCCFTYGGGGVFVVCFAGFAICAIASASSRTC